MDGTSDLFQRCPDKFFFFLPCLGAAEIKIQRKIQGLLRTQGWQANISHHRQPQHNNDDMKRKHVSELLLYDFVTHASYIQV